MLLGPYTIKQLANAMDMDVAEIGRLQEVGLLQPPRRAPGLPYGRLAYHQEHVDRLTFIRQAERLGFSLDDVSRILGLDSLATCADVYRIAESCVRRLTEKTDSDAIAVKELARLMESCPRVGSRFDCPIISTLSHRGIT